MQALANKSGRLVIDLHRVLSDIDPARWHAGAADRSRRQLAELRERLKRLTAAKWPASADRLRVPLTELGQHLDTMPDTESTMATAQARWMAFKRSVEPSYEALQRVLRAFEIHVPSLRPTNYRRNLLHVGTALMCIGILWAVPDPVWGIAIAVPACLMGWTLEVSRRRSKRVNAALMKVLHPIAHPHEYRRVNSATWYTTALALLSLTQAPLASAVGLAVLGLGDPAAALFGRRFGRIEVRHGRTLEGSLAFVLMGTLAGYAAVSVFAPGMTFTAALVCAASGAVAGAAAELLSLRVDDNLSVPLAAAGGAALAAFLV